MKAIVPLLILFIVGFYLSSCDSVSDSKATGVAPPSLVYPANGDTNISKTPLFTWTGNADKLQIDENSAFSSPSDFNVSGTQFQLPAANILNGNTYYYWRAGISSSSNTYWSTDIFYFRTKP